MQTPGPERSMRATYLHDGTTPRSRVHPPPFLGPRAFGPLWAGLAVTFGVLVVLGALLAERLTS